MENFKFILSSIFIILLLGGAGYWAFTTIESGSTHVDAEKQKELEQKNIDLEKQVADLTRENSLLQTAQDDQAQKLQDAAVVETPTTPVKTTTPTKTATLKYQSLINEIQKLVDGNIYLKLKSQGTAVGTLQKFLNIYNNTSTKIDNDYGPGVVTAVKKFQKTEGLSQDGEVGSNTFKKMITWLKSK
jgi:murein L,D-transpeptidase YcbB/YkuD